MKNLLILIVLTFLGCSKETRIKLNFLDEFILKDSLEFKNLLIGGFSGIDYYNNDYYLVIDDVNKPRFLKAKISM